jgi:plasmid stabilization system protein ParE
VRVTFNELAERELNEAASYYEQEQLGLGVGFLADVRGTVERLAEHPDAGTKLLPTVRRRLCPRFPYAVLYEIKPTEVRILAIMNLRRRPGYWVGRR